MDQTPNALAYLVLALWPAVTWALLRGLGPARGLLAALVGGYLLLPPQPAGFDFPLMPPLNKDTIPSLAALLLAALMFRPRLVPLHPLATALVALGLLSPLATVLANADPVAWGAYVLPGLSLKEGAGALLNGLLMLAPLLLARAWLADEAGHRLLLRALLAGGLLYSLPMLLEVRLSPQLNIWVYGFFQHLFSQMIRGDGFRPVVFLYHGLWAAFFAMTAFVAALALAREATGRRAVALFAAALWMLMTLVLCKSLASLLYALLMAPLILLLRPRATMAVACLLASLTLAYPVLKGAGLAPTDVAVALAERVSAERAFSLQFRLDNEDVLLARAEERPLLGWGLWGRNQVLEQDSGRPLTISDGRWIIVLGIFGWVGLVAEFGLLALPLFLAFWRSRGASPGVATGLLALLLGVNMVDLIPNATLTPITWLCAGALLGWAEQRARAPREAPAPAFRTVVP